MSGEATRIETLIATGAVVLSNDGNKIECTHRTREPRRRTIADGRVQVVNQCLICGDAGNATGGGRNADPRLPEFNHQLGQQFREEWYAHAGRLRAAAEEQMVAVDYRDYINSATWKAKRARVMRRAGGLCECCLDRQAVQVHHTTYKNIGDEPCWELRAICLECHGKFRGSSLMRARED